MCSPSSTPLIWIERHLSAHARPTAPSEAVPRPPAATRLQNGGGVARTGVTEADPAEDPCGSGHRHGGGEGGDGDDHDVDLGMPAGTNGVGEQKRRDDEA